MAVYGATKAFVLSFSEALWAENRGRGVRVLALCPGATETPFFDVVGAAEASVGGARERPEVVVARALKAFEKGRSYLISGTKNYLMAHAGRFLPRATIAATTGQIMRPKTPRAVLDERPTPRRLSA
jgi:short-subunit dehydrogenase